MDPWLAWSKCPIGFRKVWAAPEDPTGKPPHWQGGDAEKQMPKLGGKVQQMSPHNGEGRGETAVEKLNINKQFLLAMQTFESFAVIPQL